MRLQESLINQRNNQHRDILSGSAWPTTSLVSLLKTGPTKDSFHIIAHHMLINQCFRHNELLESWRPE